jgi:hypothetical protein
MGVEIAQYVATPRSRDFIHAARTLATTWRDGLGTATRRTLVCCTTNCKQIGLNCLAGIASRSRRKQWPECTLTMKLPQ